MSDPASFFDFKVVCHSWVYICFHQAPSYHSPKSPGLIWKSATSLFTQVPSYIPMSPWACCHPKVMGPLPQLPSSDTPYSRAKAPDWSVYFNLHPVPKTVLFLKELLCQVLYLYLHALVSMFCPINSVIFIPLGCTCRHAFLLLSLYFIPFVSLTLSLPDQLWFCLFLSIFSTLKHPFARHY